MRKIAKVRTKRQHLLLLSAVAALIGIGILGAAGYGGFSGFFAGPNHGYNGMGYNGIGSQSQYFTRNTFNGMPVHAYNETNVIRSQAAVDQCKTDYANGVSSVAYSKLGLNISSAQVDQANTNLQGNVTANATSWDTRISFAFFANAFQDFMLHYMVAIHQLNSTAASSLRTSLNSTTGSLQNCISSNRTMYAWPMMHLGGSFRWFSGWMR